MQTLESQLSSQNQARPVRILSPAPGEEILGTPGRVQDDNGLAKHVEVYHWAIFLAPLVPLEPGVVLWVLVDIADDRQPGRARW